MILFDVCRMVLFQRQSVIRCEVGVGRLVEKRAVFVFGGACVVSLHRERSEWVENSYNF